MLPIIWHSGKGKTIERIKNIRGFSLLLRNGFMSLDKVCQRSTYLSYFDSQIHSVGFFIAPEFIGLQEPQHWWGWGYHQLMWWVSDSTHWTQISQGTSPSALRYWTYSLLQRKTSLFSFWESRMKGPDGQQESALTLAIVSCQIHCHVHQHNEEKAEQPGRKPVLGMLF